MAKKQTAVEQLEKLFYTYAESTGIDNDKWVIKEEDLDKLFEQAKEMEKKQIIDACNLQRNDYRGMPTYNKSGEQYYNDTYKSE
jgi:hypothetical protein